jgi:hypothetical protein
MMVLLVAVALLASACGEASVEADQLPFACRQDEGTTLVHLARVDETPVYTAEVEDPLFACPDKGALVTGISNTSGYSISLARSDIITGTPAGTPTITTTISTASPTEHVLGIAATLEEFRDWYVKGLWQAQYLGGPKGAQVPLEISIEIQWKKP